MTDGTTHNATRETLLRICQEALDVVGYELVDLELSRDGRGWVLRVYIDHPEDPDRPGAGVAEEGELAGAPRSLISLADCEVASRQLGATLDVEDPIDAAYRLEVSSPGVRRPLRKAKDFKRFIGRLVRIRLAEKLQNRKNFNGRLQAADDSAVEVEVDGRAYRLPLADIRSAHLELEL